MWMSSRDDDDVEPPPPPPIDEMEDGEDYNWEEDDNKAQQDNDDQHQEQQEQDIDGDGDSDDAGDGDGEDATQQQQQQQHTIDGKKSGLRFVKDPRIVSAPFQQTDGGIGAPLGIPNQGNDCWANAMLQGLLQSVEFPKQVYDAKYLDPLPPLSPDTCTPKDQLLWQERNKDRLDSNQKLQCLKYLVEMAVETRFKRDQKVMHPLGRFLRQIIFPQSGNDQMDVLEAYLSITGLLETHGEDAPLQMRVDKQYYLVNPVIHQSPYFHRPDLDDTQYASFVTAIIQKRSSFIFDRDVLLKELWIMSDARLYTLFEQVLDTTRARGYSTPTADRESLAPLRSGTPSTSTLTSTPRSASVSVFRPLARPIVSHEPLSEREKGVSTLYKCIVCLFWVVNMDEASGRYAYVVDGWSRERLEQAIQLTPNLQRVITDKQWVLTISGLKDKARALFDKKTTFAKIVQAQFVMTNDLDEIRGRNLRGLEQRYRVEWVHRRLLKLPTGIQLFLVRFDHDQALNRSYKIEDPFPVDEYIELQFGDEVVEELQATSGLRFVQFHLQHVIIHQGSTQDKGHYISLVRHLSHWYLCNDVKVRQLTMVHGHADTEEFHRLLKQGYGFYYARTYNTVPDLLPIAAAHRQRVQEMTDKVLQKRTEAEQLAMKKRTEDIKIKEDRRVSQAEAAALVIEKIRKHHHETRQAQQINSSNTTSNPSNQNIESLSAFYQRLARGTNPLCQPGQPDQPYQYANNAKDMTSASSSSSSAIDNASVHEFLLNHPKAASTALIQPNSSAPTSTSVSNRFNMEDFDPYSDLDMSDQEPLSFGRNAQDHIEPPGSPPSPSLSDMCYEQPFHGSNQSFSSDWS